MTRMDSWPQDNNARHAIRSRGTLCRGLVCGQLLSRQWTSERVGGIVRGDGHDLVVIIGGLRRLTGLVVRLPDQDQNERVALVRPLQIGDRTLVVAAVEGDVAG